MRWCGRNEGNPQRRRVFKPRAPRKSNWPRISPRERNLNFQQHAKPKKGENFKNIIVKKRLKYRLQACDRLNESCMPRPQEVN